MYSTLTALVIIGALLWFWRDSLRAREIAARASRRACEAERVQFLDDTVAVTRIRPVLYRGRPALRRFYQFEFSREGHDRAAGRVTVTGHWLDDVWLEGPAAATWTVVDIASVRPPH